MMRMPELWEDIYAGGPGHVVKNDGTCYEMTRPEQNVSIPLQCQMLFSQSEEVQYDATESSR